jgi:hypothetical protein
VSEGSDLEPFRGMAMAVLICVAAWVVIALGVIVARGFW